MENDDNNLEWSLDSLSHSLDNIPVFMKICKPGAKIFQDVETTFPQYLQERKQSVDPVYAMDIVVEGIPLEDHLHTSILFKDNWLDAMSKTSFRVMFVGGPSTCCGLHVDTCGIHSYIILLQGVKLYYLFPPEAEEQVLNHFVHGQRFPVQLTPTLCSQFLDAKGLVIKFCAGEGIFIPAGWWHAATNVTDTIAWRDSLVNASNISVVTILCSSTKLLKMQKIPTT